MGLKKFAAALTVVGSALSLSACATPRASVSSAAVPAMIRVPAGHFVAGSEPAETDAVHYPAENARREQPARAVAIERGFAIGRTEVTRGQFARFAAETGWKPDGPCSFLPDGIGGRWTADAAHDWRHPGFAQTDDHPVVCVNLADATAYAAWLSRRTGRSFRLPSNTEWEYAARAGIRAAAPWEASAANPCAFGNLSDRSRAFAHNRGAIDPALYFACDAGFVGTAPVASFQPNAWGLHDVLGNVWEWTLDCLNADQSGAPQTSAPRTTGDCRSHIDRGSSWVNSPKYVRFAAQHPDLVEARTSVLGFRLVEDLP
ncbi:SUMF1/EgtB/PvdO family nonheme iron enzyme [Novosphingobium sp. Gsoil 351]|uniref:formylglycine-generating enzyme family protein n=1 Tax=Novosphingobium sp. Gsoil 351 TaxID=2675225 RepID=UPI0012B464EF|nr:SUMF1/EgtB/PvdO family nonheme iron enzyme [Novosphingobium sp. Gsoil 351]QGN55857.1 SUMF1/EgtB/PvdO family nonheme iron enzyme [Novosphingobium sp. Gsoil 351]